MDVVHKSYMSGSVKLNYSTHGIGRDWISDSNEPSAYEHISDSSRLWTSARGGRSHSRAPEIVEVICGLLNLPL
jgi:hypothetical protein